MPHSSRPRGRLILVQPPPWRSAAALIALLGACSSSSGTDSGTPPGSDATSATSALGQACAENAACSSGLCIPETTSESGIAWTGGSCSQLCGTAAACPTDGVCVTFADGGAYCASACAGADTCRTGYVCSNAVGACLPDCRLGWSCGTTLTCDSATGTCVAPSGGGGAVGAGCTLNTDCESSLCIPETGTDSGAAWSQGYCSQTCSGDGLCPDGAVCVPFGDGSAYCAAGCGDATACRAGYVCSPAVGGCLPDCRQGWSCGTTLICDATTGLCATGTGSIGGPCTLNAECASALCTPAQATSTGTTWTGGSCTQACSAGAPCPTGASCVSFADGTSYCSGACAADSDCRSGYVCATAVSACLPDCRAGFDCGTFSCNATTGTCE